MRLPFRQTSGSKAILDSLSRSQAIIEFDLTGRVLTANDNFCNALGYELTEIIGKHHSLFVDPDEAKSPEYKAFWANLGSGKFDRKQYKRFAKGGRAVWIEASYNPVFKGDKPFKVIKLATDITETKLKAIEDAAKLAAISQSQAVIEFEPTGKILTANENFCTTLGYELDEIVGKHHRIFCDPAYTKTAEYGEFWDSLAAGQFSANEFMRLSKDGREVWIQAAYNPIADDTGRIVKVVKFATDVTARMTAISQLAVSLRALADGDLTRSLDTPFVPTMEQVRKDFNEVLAELRSTMQTIEINARGIASGSNEIRSAADELAGRTEKQAASVEETAAALEQITTTVSDANLRATESAEMVSQTRQNAEKSGEIVSEAVTAMSRIEESSREITNIIGVIDDIAFQTNLLALNAGVEAARAGDAGRGFAVVAQEVRELAQRSATAAKEIKSLITASGQQVSLGVSLVDKTGKSLEEIVAQVQNIDANIQAIAKGAKEQAVGLKEINDAVTMIDQGTQQNAAMVEQTTASSHSLAGEADGLFDLLRRFQLGTEPEQRQPQPREQAPSRRQPADGERQPASLQHALTARLSARLGGSSAAQAVENWAEF